MHTPIVLALLATQCALCPGIRVPVDWTDSEVDTSEQFKSTIQKDGAPPKVIPNEYFQYPAKKPQFTVELIKAHPIGVQSPEKLFRPQPIKPHNNLPKPKLGHRVHPENSVVRPYRGFVQSAGGSTYAKPATTSFEVFHPYKSEEPALQQLYKAPNLDKVRKDFRDSDRKLQQYQNEAGKSDVTKDEYLERPEEIDRRKLPQKNIPTEYEVHRPQRRPVYNNYPPKHRENVVSQKLRHPWNQNVAKVTPIHYRPIKTHLHGLRQQHALKFDDERNEYPQLPPQDNEEKSEGYDIYQKGKERFEQLRDNVDEKINKAVQENRHQSNRNLEPLSDQRGDDDSSNEADDEQEFVPVKNYAQVRKTEVTKHLPREAALEDAETLEEILNAPRLREAVKSKKAQIVYSEEGYEDTAYDHAGEQKHASDHEKHGGYLKQNAESQGKYKTPFLKTKQGSKIESTRGNQIEHDEKWDSDLKEDDDEEDSDYYESEEGESKKEDSNEITEESEKNSRNKRNSVDIIAYSHNEISKKNLKVSNVRNKEQDIAQHDVNKREASNKNPKKEVATDSNIKNKYPYYFQNIKLLSKNSPLRYAENLEFIPKKSNGGTEFYDSRSRLECPEVEDDVDALPDKLKKDGHPDESLEDLSEEAKDKAKFSTLKNKQRLKGLGDKIDCFKVKYFGENPLDSPFFNEDIIENPEPVTKPNLEIFKSQQKEKLTEVALLPQNSDIFIVLNELRKIQKESSTSSAKPILLTNVHNKGNSNNLSFVLNSTSLTPIHVRNKRASPFTYEPYKIIRDSQIQDSKKTTTTGNISPLIKQLQASRVIEKVTNQTKFINKDKDQLVKKNNTKIYKNIDKGDRQENRTFNHNNITNVSFVDVNSDLRRGEPRYEIRPANHKQEYSPVANIKAISLVDYKTQTASTESTAQTAFKRSKRRKPTIKPYFDVSQFLPKNLDTQQTASSNNVRRIIRTTTSIPTADRIKRQKSRQSSSSEKEYDEYINKPSEKIKTSTSTTIKPARRKRIRGTFTTSKPINFEVITESPKLRLVTRFSNYEPIEATSISYDTTENPTSDYIERDPPKFTEKKRKSTKSTLVTDTKSYGVDDDDDMRKEEVDDLIGVQHDTEYLPLYERVVNKINRMKEEDLKNKKEHNYDVSIYDDHFPDDEDEEDEEEEEESEDGDINKNNDDDEEEEFDEREEKEANSESNNKGSSLEITTSEPTKRTLDKTTETPFTTTESQSAKLQLKPTISKKKIEIHKELPINKSLPHVTQFKQDIKEDEVVKELVTNPKKKSNKNLEALEIFRDEKLAEDVNKLGDVEVFKENLDLKSGPKHGGNYRSITPEELEKENLNLEAKNKDDAEASQTVNKEMSSKRRGINHGSQNSGESIAKFIDHGDSYDLKPRLHGGNLKLPQNRGQNRYRKSEKYVDVDINEHEEEEPSSLHGGNFKSYGNSRNSGRRMHGGNYRSAKLVKADETEEKPAQNRGKSKDRGNAATSLSGYARAVPILTTTPGYILDPSKRMYYYVDA